MPPSTLGPVAIVKSAGALIIYPDFISGLMPGQFLES